MSLAGRVLSTRHVASQLFFRNAPNEGYVFAKVLDAALVAAEPAVAEWPLGKAFGAVGIAVVVFAVIPVHDLDRAAKESEEGEEEGALVHRFKTFQRERARLPVV